MPWGFAKAIKSKYLCSIRFDKKWINTDFGYQIWTWYFFILCSFKIVVILFIYWVNLGWITQRQRGSKTAEHGLPWSKFWAVHGSDLRAATVHQTTVSKPCSLGRTRDVRPAIHNHGRVERFFGNRRLVFYYQWNLKSVIFLKLWWWWNKKIYGLQYEF